MRHPRCACTPRRIPFPRSGSLSPGRLPSCRSTRARALRHRLQGFVPLRNPDPESTLPSCAPSPLLPWVSGSPPSPAGGTFSERSAAARRSHLTVGDCRSIERLAVARPRSSSWGRTPRPAHLAVGRGRVLRWIPRTVDDRRASSSSSRFSSVRRALLTGVRRRFVSELLGVFDVKERV